MLKTASILVFVFLFTSALGSSAQMGWFSQNSGTTVSLYDVSATDSLRCWAVGSQNCILHTEDGGETWQDQNDLEPGLLTAVCFIDSLTGWAVGTGGDITHTSDGGENWTAQNSGTYVDLWSVFFTDASNGWAAGGKWYVYFGNVRIILHTTDGGNSWETQLYEQYEPTIRGIHFPGANTGYTAGDAASILATIDGGTNWEEQSSGVSEELQDIFFTSLQTGVAVGDLGTVTRTTDGGTNWNQVTSGTFSHLNGLSFADEFTGWAVGGTSTTSVIMRTLDGGITWESQEAETKSLLRGVHFVDSSNGWAVGFGGTIIHTTTGGSTSVENPDNDYAPGITGLSVYPQPFAGHASISFDLANPATVHLQLFDIQGRLVATAIYTDLSMGSHSEDFSGDRFPAGVYHLRLTAGSASISETCVLIR